MSQIVDQAIDQVLKIGKTQGLQMDVLAVEKKSSTLSFQKRTLNEFSSSETRQMGVRVLNGQNEGLAYTEALDEASLRRLVEEAKSNAQMIAREWMPELSEARNMATLDGLYDAESETLSMDAKIQAAKDLEGMALDFDSRIVSVPYSRFATSSSHVWIANSKGLRGDYRTSMNYAYARCLARGEDGGNVMATEVDARRKARHLDAGQVAKASAEKTLLRLGAARPKTGRYTVVFENQVAQSLIEFIEGYFSAKAVDERTSPLAGKLGQKIFSEKLTLTDDPFYVSAFGSRPFDEEGFASRKTPLVEEGRLTHFLTNSVFARKLKLKHTASASRSPSTDLDIAASNLIVATGTHGFDDLVNADQSVVVITDLLGHSGFRASSGDFSLPVEGFLYQNGKRSVALKDFLISGNILQLFSAVEAVGNDLHPTYGNAVCPSLLIRDLNISGES
jgi:PmbA protein